ncbi:Nn.00g026060.m01.CDS01 [Neocucurbitaria sp. VM-36]
MLEASIVTDNATSLNTNLYVMNNVEAQGHCGIISHSGEVSGGCSTYNSCTPSPSYAPLGATTQLDEQWRLGDDLVQTWHDFDPAWLAGSNVPRNPQRLIIPSETSISERQLLTTMDVSPSAALDPPVSTEFHPTKSSAMERSSIKIGTMYGTASLDAFVFKCSIPECADKTFRRWYELKRHYNGAHTAEGEGEAFWCEVVGCVRSALACGRPFPRKDKLHDHMRKIHCAET